MYLEKDLHTFWRREFYSLRYAFISIIFHFVSFSYLTLKISLKVLKEITLGSKNTINFEITDPTVEGVIRDGYFKV